MKRIYKYGILPLLVAAFCLGSCSWDPYKHDRDPEVKMMELYASTDELVLEEETLGDMSVTFVWTMPKSVHEDDMVTCTSWLDIVGNNYGSTTAIKNDEEEGIFTRTFTADQINTWATSGRWGNLKPNQLYTLEFRICYEWSGGPAFQAPEVEVVRVPVTPVKVFVFEADKVFIAGSAVGGSKEISRTLENNNILAWVGNLSAGALQIPAEYQGETFYVVPSDGEGTLMDGQAEAVTMANEPLSWEIPADGQYRIVLNMEQTTVTIYSEATDLKPNVVEWMLGAELQTTTVTKLYIYQPWAWDTERFMTPSLADPQIFVYSGSEVKQQTKFGVAAHNNSYVYSAGLDGVAVSVTHGVSYNLAEGSGGANPENARNTYFNLPSGTKFIVLDTRNKTMVTYAEKP